MCVSGVRIANMRIIVAMCGKIWLNGESATIDGLLEQKTDRRGFEIDDVE